MLGKVPANSPTVIQEPFIFSVLNILAKFVILIMVIFLLVTTNVQQTRLADISKSNRTLLNHQASQDASQEATVVNLLKEIREGKDLTLDTKRRLKLFCSQNHFNCKGISP